jgi:5-methylcytosine-specific restriction endonuclease McrA
MANKLHSRYNEKANDSFRTKIRLYMFSKSLNNNWQTFGMDDFRQFEISKELAKTYTTEYWQYEPDYKIKDDLTNDFIQKEIAQKEIALKAEIEALRQEYINKIFPLIFPPEKFDSLINAEECVYCGITTLKVVELANKQQLFKKNYRGWSLEVDRIDSNYEYSPENCVMACYWCNNAKTDEFTHEEFKEIGKTIRNVWEKRLGRLLDVLVTNPKSTHNTQIINL